jgi:DNA-directed RNA polymerase specialized sigma24 family protein
MDQALDFLDPQLQALATLAQQHPPLTQERQIALQQLVNGILRSKRLGRPRQGQFVGIYEDIYSEAVQELLLYICQHIEKYDSSRGSVMAWVNVLLDRRFFREAIPKVLGKPDVQRVSLSAIDHLDLSSPESTPSLTEILEECVTADPENLLKMAHVRDCPTANFQVLMQRRLAGVSWEAIADEFEVKISTVSNFYYRCLSKFSPMLKAYCLGNPIPDPASEKL